MPSTIIDNVSHTTKTTMQRLVDIIISPRGITLYEVMVVTAMLVLSIKTHIISTDEVYLYMLASIGVYSAIVIACYLRMGEAYGGCQVSVLWILAFVAAFKIVMYLNDQACG